MSSNQPDFGDLLRHAQEMQQHLAEAQAAAAGQTVEGRSGGGVVTVEVSGDMEFRAVHIDSAAVDPADVGLLEDLVLAALHDAVSRVQQLNQDALGDLGGDLGGVLGGFGGGAGGLGGPVGG
ncbi:MAG TPA: YbaB/EbfC family nucleoid-associated protein [Acidimicrobiales bacterium]|nr:YbaB/EbfC family nucleoid-associated protein [Acidimicrobiales bacterium]